MEEQQTPSVEQETSGDATLDQVYEQYKVEDVAQQFAPQRAQAPQPAPQQPPAMPTIPDPVLDPQGFRQSYASETAVLRQSVQALQSQLSQIGQREAKAREEADIKAAISTVQDAGFQADPDFVEIALGQKARQDSKFLAIYQNRHRNPQAWKAALGAVANEFKGKYQFRADAQLAENVRAAKTSSSTSQSTQRADVTGDDARFHGKTGRDFDAEWSRYVNAGY